MRNTTLFVVAVFLFISQNANADWNVFDGTWKYQRSVGAPDYSGLSGVCEQNVSLTLKTKSKVGSLQKFVYWWSVWADSNLPAEQIKDFNKPGVTKCEEVPTGNFPGDGTRTSCQRSDWSTPGASVREDAYVCTDLKCTRKTLTYSSVYTVESSGLLKLQARSGDGRSGACYYAKVRSKRIAE